MNRESLLGKVEKFCLLLFDFYIPPAAHFVNLLLGIFTFEEFRGKGCEKRVVEVIKKIIEVSKVFVKKLKSNSQKIKNV
jgi:hypothetical protein